MLENEKVELNKSAIILDEYINKNGNYIHDIVKIIKENVKLSGIVNVNIDTDGNFQIQVSAFQPINEYWEYDENNGGSGHLNFLIYHFLLLMDKEGKIKEKTIIQSPVYGRFPYFENNSIFKDICFYNYNYIRDENNTIIKEILNIEKITIIDGKPISNVSIFKMEKNYTFSLHDLYFSKKSIHLIFQDEEDKKIHYMKLSKNGEVIVNESIVENERSYKIYKIFIDNEDNPIIIYSKGIYLQKNPIYYLKIVNNNTIKKKISDDKNYTENIKGFVDTKNNLHIIREGTIRKDSLGMNNDYWTLFISYNKFDENGNLIANSDLEITEGESFKLYENSNYHIMDRILIPKNDSVYYFYNVGFVEHSGGRVNRFIVRINYDYHWNREFIKIDYEGNVMERKNFTPLVDETSPFYYWLSLLTGIIFGITIIIIIHKRTFHNRYNCKIKNTIKEEMINNGGENGKNR